MSGYSQRNDSICEKLNDEKLIVFVLVLVFFVLVCSGVILVGVSQPTVPALADDTPAVVDDERSTTSEDAVTDVPKNEDVSAEMEETPETTDIPENEETEFDAYPESVDEWEYYYEEPVGEYVEQDWGYYGDWEVVESYAGNYGDGTLDSLRYSGVETDGVHQYTWYSETVLPGYGLDIPGRHVGDNGAVMDEDGYICVASSDYEKGTVLETLYGDAKVYDTGCASGVIDVYVH